MKAIPNSTKSILAMVTEIVAIDDKGNQITLEYINSYNKTICKQLCNSQNLTYISHQTKRKALLLDCEMLVKSIINL